jgi:hypothetical protein
MGRLVTARTVGTKAAGGNDQDGPLSRIAKYVPSEVLAFFAMWTQAVASLSWKDVVLPAEIGGAVIGLIVTYVYFDRFFPQSPASSRSAHKWVSSGAFAVHAYNLSAGAIPAYFIPGIALALTALITLLSVIVIPTEGK